MGIWNAVGGRDEVETNNGVAHLLEHMAFKGTLTKNALQIAETIEDVGGDINAYTSKEITAYYVKLLADDLHYGVDILTDILQNSAFAEDELNRERGVIIQEIGMYLDTPDDMIFDYWQEKAFPNQPMGRSILGKTDIIKNISREEVKGFMTNHYNPNKMIISAAGKIDHDAFVEMIIKSCTNLPVGTSNNRSISDKEITRGKAQLKASLMMGRESAFRRCESAARQLLVFNKVIDPSETLEKINAVSKESVEKIAKQIVSGPMTISSIGPIKNLEKLEQIQSRLN